MAAWTNRERVLAYAHAQTRQLIDFLARELDQATVDSIEAAITPAPTDAQKRVQFAGARQTLLASGIPADDPAVLALAGRIAALPADARGA